MQQLTQQPAQRQQQRDYILIYLNGKRIEISGKQAFLTLSDFLREQRRLSGTKVVCAEGDCGACTVLVGAVKPGLSFAQMKFQAINSCIQFMHGLDCSHIITIEALNKQAENQLHPVQLAMVEAQATQCGFCTPGFVMAAAGMLETIKESSGETTTKITPQKAKNYLTGNLCRCTGYQSIINAMVDLDLSQTTSIKDLYHSANAHENLLNYTTIPVEFTHQQDSFFSPVTIKSAVHQLAANKAKIFAASTDLGVQFNKGQWQVQQVLSLNLIPQLHEIQLHENHVSIGARVTLTDIEQQLKSSYPEWIEFMHVFASPQIKNNGTLIGNIANGSPIGDNLPFLLAFDAELIIQNKSTTRIININDFYLGFREKDLADNEIITRVNIPLKPEHTFVKLYKVSQRRDLDISCVAAAFKMVFNGDNEVIDVAVALGGVAATALRLPAVEQQLIGLTQDELLDPAHQQQTAELIAQAIKPLSDVRGSAEYRTLLVKNLYLKFVMELSEISTTDSEVLV